MAESKGCVAAGHPQTARAAADVLRAGGNAFDAACAAALTACAAEPVLASLGGGGFAMAAPADGPIRVFDFFTETPSARPPSPDGLDFHPVLADFGTTTQEFHIGLASMAVPGMVRGVFDLLAALGTLPASDVFAPAVAAARSGVVVNAFQSHLFDVVNPIFVAEAECRSIFGPGDGVDGAPGRLYTEGETLAQPDLADTFAALAEDGADAFYDGPVAAQVVADCRARGGLLRSEDFRAYRTCVRDPVVVRHGGGAVHLNPPPSAGGSLIGVALRVVAEAGPAAPWGGADHVTALAEAMLAAQAARAGVGHDADPGDDALIAALRAQVAGRADAPRGTTHISVVDAAGNAAAVTLSNGEGCGYVVPGTGVVMNNMLGEEDLNPAGFHRWTPGTRMISMMAPTVVRGPDGRLVCLGSGGSNRIRSAVLQVLVNVLDFGLPVAEAVSAPRLHIENGRLDAEPGIDVDAVGDFGGAVAERRSWERQSLFFGGAHAVVRAPDGRFDAAGDPRRGGVALEA
jgi:gamma-glutamyltranspeptidase/glutathione hydrolase